MDYIEKITGKATFDAIKRRITGKKDNVDNNNRDASDADNTNINESGKDEIDKIPRKLSFNILRRFSSKKKKNTEPLSDEEVENNRVYNTIYKYMQSLESNLNKEIGEIHEFFVMVDDHQFKKLPSSLSELENITVSQYHKYKNKHIAKFSIGLFHNEYGKKTIIWRNNDAWITCTIWIYTVDENGYLIKKHLRRTNWVWGTNDFKKTKLTDNLLQFIMRVIDKDMYNFSINDNIKLSDMIELMEKDNISFDGILEALEDL